MSSLGGWGVPGTGTLDSTNEFEILWGGDYAKGHVLSQLGNYSGAIRDAGNTPTTDIRGGLLVGKVTSSGELEEWDADATDGTEELFGVVPHEIRAQDFNATNQDRVAGVIVKAPFKASQLLIEGAAFVGHANEYAARRALHQGGSILDDDPQGYLAGGMTRFQTVSGTTDTLTASQTGSVITYSNAASVTVTLPDPLIGLEYFLIRTGDEEFIVTSTSLDDIIGPNNAAADTVTYTTATEHIGAVFHCIAVDDAGTVKWFVHTNVTQTAASAG